MNTEKERALAVDGNSLLNVGYYATLKDDIENSRIQKNTLSGENANGASFFLDALLVLLSKIKPKYLVVAWDASDLIRKKLFPDYKSNRKEKPSEFISQISLIEDILKSFGVKQLRFKGYEADDILGNLSKIYEGEKYEKLFLTGDRDLFQLINENTSILYMPPNKMSFIEKMDVQKENIFPYSIKMDRTICKKYMGIYPEQITDLKGLGGDNSDCIPGVNGISEKTAAFLLDKFNSLERIYQNACNGVITDTRVVNAIQKTPLQNVKNYKYLASLFPIPKLEGILPERFEKSLDMPGLYQKLAQLGFSEIIRYHGLDKYGSKPIGNGNSEEDTKQFEEKINVSDTNFPQKVFQLTPEEKKKMLILLILFKR